MLDHLRVLSIHVPSFMEGNGWVAGGCWDDYY